MSETTNSSGLGFAGLLTIVFITLKLTHVIDWSWWWVISPIWIGLLATILAVGIALVFSIRWGGK